MAHWDNRVRLLDGPSSLLSRRFVIEGRFGLAIHLEQEAVQDRPTLSYAGFGKFLFGLLLVWHLNSLAMLNTSFEIRKTPGCYFTVEFFRLESLAGLRPRVKTVSARFLTQRGLAFVCSIDPFLTCPRIAFLGFRETCCSDERKRI